MEKKSIGEYISALRKVNGLTQKQLAEKLGVTDKSISRWENGDSLPDLSQIPVMAEIFGVTCDEILSGEKRQPKETENFGTQTSRGEKRVKKLVKDTKSDFKNKTLISYGILALGVLCVLLCNFAFLKGGLGFLLGCGFFIASLICQTCFSGSCKNKIDSEEMPAEFADLSAFILQQNKKYTHIAVYAFAISLPCAVLLGNINAGLDFPMFAVGGLACSIFAFILNITVVDSIFFKKMINEELVEVESVETRKTQARLQLRNTFAVIFVVLTIATTGIYVMFSEMAYELFAQPKTFTAEQVPEFVEFMQTPEKRNEHFADGSAIAPAPAPEIVFDGENKNVGELSEYKNADGEYITKSELESYKKVIDNRNTGEIIATYYELNENVSGMSVSWSGDKLLRIEVSTYDMYSTMRVKQIGAIMNLFVIYAVLSIALAISGVVIENKKLAKIK